MSAEGNEIVALEGQLSDIALLERPSADTLEYIKGMKGLGYFGSLSFSKEVSMLDNFQKMQRYVGNDAYDHSYNQKEDSVIFFKNAQVEENIFTFPMDLFVMAYMVDHDLFLYMKSIYQRSPFYRYDVCAEDIFGHTVEDIGDKEREYIDDCFYIITYFEMAFNMSDHEFPRTDVHIPMGIKRALERIFRPDFGYAYPQIGENDYHDSLDSFDGMSREISYMFFMIVDSMDPLSEGSTDYASSELRAVNEDIGNVASNMSALYFITKGKEGRITNHNFPDIRAIREYNNWFWTSYVEIYDHIKKKWDERYKQKGLLKVISKKNFTLTKGFSKESSLFIPTTSSNGSGNPEN